jgi:hypothetical protein
MRSGLASLPLHHGKAPAWLFQRMVRLAGAMLEHIVEDYGPAEVLRRLADPHWFQAFGCVLGFDWHSSGVTTTVCGAVKQSLAERGQAIALFAAGGKGRVSRQTPREIMDACATTGADGHTLVYASRMAAKVDNAAVQDGYQLYHHAFFFTGAGEWCVVQQGMHAAQPLARRYHWLSASLQTFVDEPHAAICCDATAPTLNLVAHDNAAVRAASVRLAAERPEVTLGALGHLPLLVMPARHRLVAEHDVPAPRIRAILAETYRHAPRDFEALLGVQGVGARTLRALALASELIHGTPLSTRDPARFAFAHGGKDGTPFPVDRATYDRTIAIFERGLSRLHIERSEKVRAFRRLAAFAARTSPAATRSTRAAAAPGTADRSPR